MNGKKHANQSRHKKSISKAATLFDSGFNCAESVLLASSEEFEHTDVIIPRIATGFGVGIGRSGNVCGALSGAVMAIGLRVGCDVAKEKRKRNSAYRGVRRMVEAFEKEFGSTQCRTLTRCDFETKEGREKYRAQGFRKNLCLKFVAWCADYVTKKHS